jgi:two-component system sensor histidine kinase UhpB
VLRVSDDGRGLRGAGEGAGMKGMRERAVLVGGTLEFAAGRTGGTQVRLEVPGDARAGAGPN